MAGAGYKLFTTGSVLTAAEVNTYLQEQTIMVFANAAARTTALASVLSEGMVSYLKDTDVVEIYTGAAWVSLDDPNAIQNSIVDAKGDLVSATADNTPARLAVGSNGDSLVADSAATTGLRWQSSFAAGKNKIINGDFYWNQRAFTSTTANNAYSFDRWQQYNGGTSGTLTVTPQTFTAGTAPVTGYEGKNFVQCVTAAGANTDTYAVYGQKVEDVRTFANQTTTVSFWAKASSGTPKIAIEVVQSFGTGGSPSADVNSAFGTVTLSTSWARYSVTVAVPSISGKTLGTANDSYAGLNLWISAGSNFNTRASSIGLQNATFQIWGVQWEAGSVATAFQTATGTIQGELAACQRYYYKHPTGVNSPITNSAAYSATSAFGVIRFPETMRTAPTLVVTTGTNYYQIVANGGVDNINSFTQDASNTDCSTIYNNTEVAQTAGHAGIFISNNTSAAIAWSAEL